MNMQRKISNTYGSSWFWQGSNWAKGSTYKIKTVETLGPARETTVVTPWEEGHWSCQRYTKDMVMEVFSLKVSCRFILMYPSSVLFIGPDCPCLLYMAFPWSGLASICCSIPPLSPLQFPWSLTPPMHHFPLFPLDPDPCSAPLSSYFNRVPSMLLVSCPGPFACGGVNLTCGTL